MTGQAGIFRLIDHAHASTAEFADDMVVGDRLTDHSKGLRLFGRYGRPRREFRSTVLLKGRARKKSPEKIAPKEIGLTVNFGNYRHYLRTGQKLAPAGSLG